MMLVLKGRYWISSNGPYCGDSGAQVVDHAGGSGFRKTDAMGVVFAGV